MSHIHPQPTKTGFDENGEYMHYYDPKYLDKRYAHLTESQKDDAQWFDDLRNER
jgi:hypothetical protein